MGLSMHENKVISKLASDIFKPSASTNNKSTTSPSNILDTHSSKILEKIKELADSNSSLQKENKEPKLYLISLDKN